MSNGKKGSNSFPIFLETYVVDMHQKRLAKALLMSIHNICFHEDIIIVPE